MNNFVSVILAVLEHAKVLTEDEAKKLVKELHGSTLPDNYEGASRFVKKIFDKHGITSMETKLTNEVSKVKDEVKLPSKKPVDTIK